MGSLDRLGDDDMADFCDAQVLRELIWEYIVYSISDLFIMIGDLSFLPPYNHVFYP